MLLLVNPWSVSQETRLTLSFRVRLLNFVCLSCIQASYKVFVEILIIVGESLESSWCKVTLSCSKDNFTCFLVNSRNLIFLSLFKQMVNNSSDNEHSCLVFDLNRYTFDVLKTNYHILVVSFYFSPRIGGFERETQWHTVAFRCALSRRQAFPCTRWLVSYSIALLALVG